MRICQVIAASVLAIALISAANSQTPAAVQIPSPVAAPASTSGPASASLPMAPAGIAYRYWPRQLVQWVGPELPYSMIELDIDDRGAKPLYDITLTSRDSGKRVHYTNQQGELAADKAAGAEAYLVLMQFDQPEQPVNGSSYLLRFATETGTPIIWQFVQGSDITEQGSGLTAFDTPTPVLLFREQGAVAGEGTALKVGNVTSTAELWKEISHPPYFVAYHGALSQDAHVVAFVPRASEWKVEPASAAVARGADWKLTSPAGASVSEHVESLTNGTATLRETNLLLGTSVTMDAVETPHGWTVIRARYAPATGKADHGITVTFAPAPSDADTSKFEVVAGRKTHLASGVVKKTPGGTESWSFTQPNWSHMAPVKASAVATR